MPQLSPEQIAQLAANAGFSGPDLPIAVAVALAESNYGYTDALGDTTLTNDTWGPSVGLWQIRSVNPGHGNAFDQATRNQQENMDPQTNADHAYAIQQHEGGNHWNEWSTYSHGDYRQYLPEAQRAADSVTTGQHTLPATDQLTRPATQNPQVQPQGGQSSNSQGFLGELEKLIESIGKLLNPANKLTKASQAATRAAASSQAFGKVSGSSSAHQRHVSNTQQYSEHASKGSQRVRTHSDDIKCTANEYQAFSQQGAQNIDQTTRGVREDMMSPAVPSNIA